MIFVFIWDLLNIYDVLHYLKDHL